uniref:Uncharacterized protein n=1 Tax=Candidatus Kentrum sp. FW TaxID=2126338 RepID=A0A450TL39_9GAMM|nr:MAG: hypothetical protein BECKFW1821C_GA0114237_101445 [Candidatus Kentron sp. FW]
MGVQGRSRKCRQTVKLIGLVTPENEKRLGWLGSSAASSRNFSWQRKRKVGFSFTLPGSGDSFSDLFGGRAANMVPRGDTAFQ